MTKREVQKLSLGLYHLFWKDGGSSLASVGNDGAGNRWYAPVNWLDVPSTDWHAVKGVIQIVAEYE